MRTRSGTTRLAIAALALLGGCGREEPAPAPAPRHHGTLEGRVRLAAGAPIPPPPAPAPPCSAGVEGRAPRDLAVDAGTRGVADAIVWIVDPPEGAPTPARPPAPAVLDQRHCEFEPRALVVAAGSDLVVRNSDPELHSIRATLEGGRRLFDLGMAEGTPDVRVPLERPGLARVRCDVHPWMGATILVVEHPYAAVADAQGAFTMPAPRPGRYTLRIFHARLGTRDVAIDVGEGGGRAEVELYAP